MKYDFSGYATKNDIPCADGRTIKRDAFKENNGGTVPLVWQHMHDDPKNVLGHAKLENREDGVYVYGKFNDTEAGKHALSLVKHGDIDALSIFANKLIQNGGDVVHGVIREVSLVLSGANPGAFIDNVSIAHSDGTTYPSDEEAVIYGGVDIYLEHSEDVEDEEAPDGETVGDIFATLSEKQKDVVYYMMAQAAGVESSINNENEKQGGNDNMKHNVFSDGKKENGEATLSHSQLQAIITDAGKIGSLKEAFLMHAQTYGIENIDVLFPDAKSLNDYPTFISRDMAWVSKVMDGTKHSPFARIKTTAADITEDEARAKGYIKGKKKKEEVFKLLKRITTPTTVYKKQKLDRDDIIDITDLNIIAWLKQEMRMMLNEELARSILVGDGREISSDDKINEDNIRPVYTDDDLYAHRVVLPAGVKTDTIIDEIVRSRKHYKGTGNPALYTTTDALTDMLLLKDSMGRRLYPTMAELQSALRVSDIIEVPVMEGMVRTDESLGKVDLVGILVNLKDYTVGADKGGEVSMFDDFDIDYNQYKYLIETRCSGALTLPKSAIIVEKKQGVAEEPGK